VVRSFFVEGSFIVIPAFDVVVLATGGYLALVISLCGHGGACESYIIQDGYVSVVHAGLSGEN